MRQGRGRTGTALDVKLSVPAAWVLSRDFWGRGCGGAPTIARALFGNRERAARAARPAGTSEGGGRARRGEKAQHGRGA
jgi:hypothetical protein